MSGPWPDDSNGWSFAAILGNGMYRIDFAQLRHIEACFSAPFTSYRSFLISDYFDLYSSGAQPCHILRGRVAHIAELVPVISTAPS